MLVDGRNVQNIDIDALSLSDRAIAPLLSSDMGESEPSISANGAWIAHIEFSADSDPVVHLRPFPEPSQTRIRVGPGVAPAFSRDGSEVLFVDGGVMTSVPIEYLDPTPTLGAPAPLFDVTGYVWLLLGRRWDIDPDGAQFLLIRRLPPVVDRIEVVLNWFEELKGRVPAE